MADANSLLLTSIYSVYQWQINCVKDFRNLFFIALIIVLDPKMVVTHCLDHWSTFCNEVITNFVR